MNSGSVTPRRSKRLPAHPGETGPTRSSKRVYRRPTALPSLTGFVENLSRRNQHALARRVRLRQHVRHRHQLAEDSQLASIPGPTEEAERTRSRREYAPGFTTQGRRLQTPRDGFSSGTVQAATHNRPEQVGSMRFLTRNRRDASRQDYWRYDTAELLVSGDGSGLPPPTHASFRLSADPVASTTLSVRFQGIPAPARTGDVHRPRSGRGLTRTDGEPVVLSPATTPMTVSHLRSRDNDLA